VRESGKHQLRHSYAIDENNAETVCENYEFAAPTDFISVAAKFGPGTEPLIEKVKKELNRLLEDAEPGWNNFFVGPFRAYMFPCGLRIYWVERRMIIDWRYRGDNLEINSFNLFPLEENSFKDDTELSSIGHALKVRVETENAVIANCVRDGRLIAIEKKDTENPEDKAWDSEGFRKAVTYLFAYHIYWHPEDIARNKSDAPTAWKIKGKIYKQKNKFKVDLLKPSPLWLLAQHNKDGSWINTEWESNMPEKLVCGNYELEIPSDIRGIASTFDKDHAEYIDVIAKALAEKNGYALEKCHFFIGPFRKYMLPYCRAIYIYWLEGNRFLFPSGDEKQIYSFETVYLDDDAPLTPKYTGRSFEENLRLVKERLAKKATGMDTAISNCINDGIMISFEPNCCKMPPVEIVDKPGAEEKK
jgi:hypothetical protein